MEFQSPTDQLGPEWGARKLTARSCSSSGRKGPLAALPGAPVNKSECSATSCLASCSSTRSALAKLSVCWAGGGTVAGVMNTLNVPHPGVRPEKLDSKVAHAAAGPSCPHQGGWVSQGRVVGRLGREQLFPRVRVKDAGLQSVGTGSISV